MTMETQRNKETVKGKFIILSTGDYSLQKFKIVSNPSVEYLDKLDDIQNNILKILNSDSDNEKKFDELNKLTNENIELLSDLIPYYIDDLNIFSSRAEFISDIKVYKIDESY